MKRLEEWRDLKSGEVERKHFVGGSFFEDPNRGMNIFSPRTNWSNLKIDSLKMLLFILLRETGKSAKRTSVS